MEERRSGEGRCRRGRGRPRMKRMAGASCRVSCFTPSDNGEGTEESIILLLEEIEAVRLVDLLDYDQESAAKTAGVSRRTLWRDLHNARRKIADALVNGKKIEISPKEND
ncbi:MAG: DUF134 domain-containing protein [Methanomicrobium sp.]|nr:DUF134 domain-containing protein [Methanomicrobium sp.]